MALTFFIILPKLFASYGTIPPIAPPFFAFGLAMAIMYLAAKQLAYVVVQLPKNSLFYNFVYCSHSQLMAFIIGWSQLIGKTFFFKLFEKFRLASYNCNFSSFCNGSYGTFCIS